MIYDFVVVWWWAAWIFSTIFAWKDLKKIILEKNKNLGIKVLLSGWERANLTNIEIEPTRDYFWQNSKVMISILKRFSQYDTISFFEENWVRLVEEDRWRIILESWNSSELLNILMNKSRENKTEFKTNFDVISIDKKDGLFYIKSSSWEIVMWKKVLISAWWKSFFQVWTEWDSYNFASDFWVKVINPYKALSAFVTFQDLSELSWVSQTATITLIDKNLNKEVYQETGPLLFTHFGISGPIVFNSSCALWTYLNKKQIFDNYEDINVNLSFRLDSTPKRVLKKFALDEENNNINLTIQNLRSWREAKLTWWWVLLDELDNIFQAKNTQWLYFAWECLDITWKTGWFSLQLAWSTGYIVWKNV